MGHHGERLLTAPRERLDLDLQEMSSDMDDDVSIANLLFFTYIYMFSSFCLIK